MAKTVGFLCALKPEWLNKTVELVIEGLEPERIRDELNDYLSYDINSPDNIRKTREMLMKLWVNPVENAAITRIRQISLDEVRNGSTDKVAFHWCMLLLHYPVFADVAGAIGKLTNMQDEFSSSWLRNKILEQWGERETVLRSVSMVLQTMRQLGAISGNRTNSTIAHWKVNDDQTRIALMKTALGLRIKPYYEPAEMAGIPQLFPFDYDVSSELIFGSGEFELGFFGGNHVLIS